MKSSRWLQTVVAIVVLAAGGEWAVRRWLLAPPDFYADARFGQLYTPGSRFVQSREGWGVFTADSAGFLDQDGPPAAPGLDGLLLGDSFGQALQVRYGQRFSEVAERAWPGLSLRNASEAGRSPIDYALALPRFQAAFHPDFVVIQCADGDLTDMEPASSWAVARADWGGTEARAAAPESRSPLRRLVRRSALIQMLRGRIIQLSQQERTRLTNKLAGVKPDLSDVVARPVHPEVVRALDSLVTEMQRVNPRLVLLYAPHIHYFAQPPEVAYPQRREIFRAVAERHDLPFVDSCDSILVELARTHEPLHGFTNTRPGEGHLNARAHAILGRELARVLAREYAPGGRWAASVPSASGEVRR